ncbi:MAG: polysaccharide biosynthesis C-terminal domain-containing protein [Bacteroidia bacterium]
MGLVARQSFKAAIATYIGLGMGVLNNLFIYPYMLTVEQYGEVQFVLQTATFFTPFLVFGFGYVLTRYYPQYKDNQASKQRFYGLVYLTVTLNILVFLAIFLLFKARIADYYESKSGVSRISVYVLIGIAAILPYVRLARNYAAIQGRIAIPSLLIQLLKFALPAFVVAYFYDYIKFDQLIVLLFAYHLVLALVFLYYMNSQDKFRPKFSWSSLKADPNFKPMVAFAGFSVLSGIGGALANQIDILMVTTMVGTYQNGLYAWSLFIANAIAVPFTLISTISVPIISQYWKDNDQEGIKRIYKQSSAVSVLVSLGIFLAFWLIIKDVFDLMPRGDEYRLGINVVWMLCVAKIIDMASGVNNQILSMSKKYPYLLGFLSVAVVLNIGLNLILIPRYGIEGSSMATIASILVYNILKLIYIKRAFNMQPFRMKNLYNIVLAGLLFFIWAVLPRTPNTIVNILLYSSSFGLIYFVLCYWFKFSLEFNEFIDKQLIRFRLKKA